MADEPSPPSSDLSDPPSIESDHEDDHLSTTVPSSRPSVDHTHSDADHLAAPPPKRRKTNHNHNHNATSSHIHTHSAFDRGDSTQPADQQDNWDNISLSSDSLSSAPGSPSHDEWTLREEAQTECLWRDCPFGKAGNNDELVKHVQGTHCATGGPKRTKYVCEWGECQRKTSNHPSGYALKAHMRSHTKEKPYYCALPECDKAFTRSDALAKHMRTVHEPELPRGALPSTTDMATPTSKSKSSKPKLSNGTTPSTTASKQSDLSTAPPIHDDSILPSPASDNITYIPAHHPLTGQPGFMIHYPPDIHFTAWESSIPADQLMRLLRRQLAWSQRENEELNAEVEMLEQGKREEWGLKEILLEGVWEGEWARAKHDGGALLRGVDEQVEARMDGDVGAGRGMRWVPRSPAWRRMGRRSVPQQQQHVYDNAVMPDAHHTHRDAQDAYQNAHDPQVGTPQEQEPDDRTPSPPPTGKSGGFDGDKDPYDNYLGDQMAHFEHLKAERERERARANSLQGTPQQVQHEAEADAVGALMGMSGGRG